MSEEIPYVGNELELFRFAVNWKNYWSKQFRPYIKGNVLEVGAGIGTTTPYLINPDVTSLTLIEPDATQSNVIREKIKDGALPSYCTVQQGVLTNDVAEQYDTICYIDVIEHIEHDKDELLRASKALKKGGHLCVLVPANPSDYSPFDKAIGHYRRYNKKMLRDVVPPSLELQWLRYLDALGAFSSKVNKYILKQPYPSKNQILFWDRMLLPLSKLADTVTGFSIGKSLLLVAKKK
jgi:SAM-dependent methyltransferase